MAEVRHLRRAIAAAEKNLFKLAFPDFFLWQHSHFLLTVGAADLTVTCCCRPGGIMSCLDGCVKLVAKVTKVRQDGQEGMHGSSDGVVCSWFCQGKEDALEFQRAVSRIRRRLGKWLKILMGGHGVKQGLCGEKLRRAWWAGGVRQSEEASKGGLSKFRVEKSACICIGHAQLRSHVCVFNSVKARTAGWLPLMLLL